MKHITTVYSYTSFLFFSVSNGCHGAWNDLYICRLQDRVGVWFCHRTDKEPHMKVFHGPYRTADEAYLAGCGYVYGPIPRDFETIETAVIGLEGCVTDASN